MWLDSQDLASIDTEVRRACSVWILGVQREQNEVKRTLSHITDAPKPKVDDIMQLERGQFFVCHGREVKKVYVQPAWATAEWAQKVAKGKAVAYVEPPRFGSLGDSPVSFTVKRVNSETGAMAAMSEPSSAVLRPFTEPEKRFRAGIGISDPVIEPDNTPKQSDYATMPAGVEHYIDDGGKDVDQQERATDHRTNNRDPTVT